MDIESRTAHRHIWDPALIRAGCAILRSRREMIDLLEAYTREEIRKMGIADIDFRFQYTCIREGEGETLEKKFEKNLHASERQEDIYKTTSVGPHRDGIAFLNHGRDMRDFSSQGQIRMTVMAAKLALAELLHQQRGIHPVFLFDDVLLEIDPVNAESILTSFGERNQIFFTSTTIPDFDFFRGVPRECFYKLTEGGRQE